ncbi:MAG: YraN family protein [Thermoflexales bacterium]|nr:YraN family protein [Thermoflexales bacterium]
MNPNRQRIGLGRRGEELAVQALRRRGYEIVERNWRCPVGEADIIARRGQEWAFVEVRTRRGEAFGTPEESITPQKRARMQAVAERYIAEQGLWEADGHLLMVAVEMDRAGRLQRVEVLEMD